MVAKREILVGEIFQHIRDVFAISTLAVGEECGAKEIEESVHAGSYFRIVIRYGDMQAGGGFQRQLVFRGCQQKLGQAVNDNLGLEDT